MKHPKSLLLIAALVAFAPRAALAQQRRPLAEALSDEARTEYLAGMDGANAGRFSDAAPHFERAYALSQDPRLLFNIGLCRLKQKDYVGANGYFERYRSQMGTLEEPDRQRLEKSVTEIREHTGYVMVRVSEPGARIVVNGRDVGTSPQPPVLVEFGSVSVVVSKDGFGEAERQVRVATPQETVNVAFQLTPAPAEAAAPPEEATEIAPGNGGSSAAESNDGKFGPPPPIYDEPPTYEPQPYVPPTPKKRRNWGGDRTHEGFYMRFGMGVGYGTDDIKNDQGQATASGTVAQFANLRIGGMIVKGLVLGADFSYWQLNDPEIKLESSGSTGDATLPYQSDVGWFTLALLTEYYFDPEGGLHVGAFIGPSSAVVNSEALSAAGRTEVTEKESGFVFGGDVGYDIWIGKRWAFGIETSVSYASISDNYETHHKIVYPMVGFNLTTD